MLQELTESREEEPELSYKGLIRVNDEKKTRWDMAIIILAVYNCFFIPFEVAYEPAWMEGAGFFVLNSVIDFCFLLDIIVNFRTTYYDPHTGDEVTNKRKIAIHYLRGRFWIDLFSTIPIDNIAMVSQWFNSLALYRKEEQRVAAVQFA